MVLPVVEKRRWAKVPKSALNKRALLAKCTYEYANGEIVKELFDIGDYWLIPREALGDSTLQKLKVEVSRPTLHFPPAFHNLPKRVSPENADTERKQRIQTEVLQIVSKLPGGVIEVEPGTGKTIMAFQLMQEWKVPSLVVVHTKDIQQQWMRKAQAMLGITNDRMGLIGGIAKKWSFRNKDLVIALVQSLTRNQDRLPVLFDKFGAVFYDEVHHMQGEKFRHALPICAGKRIGLSATANADGLETVFFNHIGPIVYCDDSPPDLQPLIYYVEVEAQLTNHQLRRIARKNTYMDAEYTFTVNEVANSHVNDAVVHFIHQSEQEKRVQLVLSDRIEQLQYVHQLAGKSSLLIGSTQDLERESALHDYTIVCATTAIALEALDRGEFDTLHICLPWSKRRRYVQGIGRILRTSNDKKQPIVYAYDPIDVPLLHNTFTSFRSNAAHFKHQRKSIIWKNLNHSTSQKL